MSESIRKGFPITAWSAVNSLGTTTEAVIQGLKSGRPGLYAPPANTPFDTVCGRVNEELPALPADLSGYDSRNNRMVQSALSELKEPLAVALDRWSPERIGLCVGSSTSAMDELEAAYASQLQGQEIESGAALFARGSAEGLLQVLRELTGISGPAIIISNACASSGKAFASAKRWLEADLVDAVLVGGADSLCQTTLRGFRALGLLSDQPSRPFSQERRGINIGEGAAFLLMERTGHGPRLLGAGESTDAHHMTSPDPEGRGACTAMETAIRDAGVSKSDVGYINAHGTGTPSNDAVEAKAIEKCLGTSSHALVVSTKGYIGHTLGTAGATEAIFVLESLCNGWVPASVGADPLDPEIVVHVPTEFCEINVNVALSNSFAFGGSNVSLAFGAPE
ncbi:MAG: beta-ketoacyl synthase N-terminal-like domain-containing protein [Myxococcota bacterium]|nr:beta-ketoacyl synthase N-terminal-like domain-containing protein [Myxococcota bacterium]